MPPEVRFYTLAEANAKVPGLQANFTQVAAHIARATELNDQVNDLEVVWGSKVLAPDCPDRADYLKYKAAVTEIEEAVDEILNGVRGEGIEIKDLNSGLIDFYAKRGAEVVFLCWQRGEKDVGFWHTLQGGFAGRKPIKEF